MNFENMTFFAAAAFGLEGLVASELKRLKMQSVQPENGGVRFSGSVADAFLCNLRLRFSDRVYLILAEGQTKSFEDLFQLVSSVAWEKIMNGNEKILLSAQCARSRLMSPRDCQSISKKAIIEKLKSRTSRKFFPESGCDFPVHIYIHSDLTRVLLNMSGSSLSRRGYRTWNGEAPIRETLASALVEMSPWRPGMPLYDPCCGTGTLLIEAALREGHMAPGRNRNFAMEEFSFFPKSEGGRIRTGILSECQPERIHAIAGSDIDPDAVILAEKHAEQAGLNGRISLKTGALQELHLTEEGGVFLCNPPYGERLSDVRTCRELYHDLAMLQKRHPSWSLCAISSDPEFEKAYGRRADKKKRLYNGRLECEYFIYRALCG